LTEVRQGFETKLVRKESDGHPIPEPPANLFRRVDFKSAIGDLGAYITVDPQDGKKHPAIVWISGGDCSTINEGAWRKSPKSNDQTACQFREAGIVTMFPSLRGGNNNPGFHEGFYGEVDDVISAARFLAAQPYVDPHRIYLGGHSSGGTMVLLAAESSAIFRAVFAIGPIHDLRAFPPQQMNQFLQFNTSNQREYELRAPILWLNSIEVPTFAFAGTERDGALYAVQAMTRESKNPKIHLFTVSAANHFDILAPTNELIAKKILNDKGDDCNIDFTVEEVNKNFAESKRQTSYGR
jgi:dipeptidyl aminopeptidase/acylaminoacyl peptidase